VLATNSILDLDASSAASRADSSSRKACSSERSSRSVRTKAKGHNTVVPQIVKRRADDVRAADGDPVTAVSDSR
jgi:hypothetical protein